MDSFRRGMSWGGTREAISTGPAQNDALIAAVTSFSVNVVGVLVLGAVYMNYVLLADYVRPLFWAGILSMPLHTLKKNIVRRVVHDARRKGGGAWTGLGMTVLKVILQKLLGPVFTYPARFFRAYFTVISRLSIVEEGAATGSESPETSSGDEDYDVEPPSPGPMAMLSRSQSGVQPSSLSLAPEKADRSPPLVKATSESSVPQSITEQTRYSRRSSYDSPSLSWLELSHSRSEKRSEGKSASHFYFSVMLRACGLYVAYSFLIFTGKDYMVVLGMGLFALMAAHLVYHLAIRLIKIYLGDFFGRFRKRVMEGLKMMDQKTNFISERLYYLLIKEPLEWSYARYRQSRKEAKSVFVKNANSVVATFLVVVSIMGILVLTLFMIFKFVYEANVLMDWCVQAVDQSLSNEMREQFRSALESAYAAAIDFGNSKLKEFYPGSQITIQDIYNKMFEVKHMTSTAVATVREPMFPGMPQTSSLVMGLADGGVGVLTDTTRIMECVEELREAGLDTLHTMYRTSGYDQYVSMATDYLSTFATSILSGTLGVFLSFCNIIMEATMFVFQVVLFVLAFHYLIANKYSVADYLSRLLSLADPKQYIRTTLETSIRGVLLVTIKMAVFHFLFTWLTFSVMGVEIIYIPAFFSGIFAAIPVISPYLIAVPASLWLYLQGHPWLSVIMIASHFGISVTADTAIYGEIPDVSPFFGGMAVLLGLYTFGIEGLVLGPLFMAVIPATYQLMAQSFSQSGADGTNQTDTSSVASPAVEYRKNLKSE